jgi:hypothetical protein
MKIIIWEQFFLGHRKRVSAVKRLDFDFDRLSYIVLRGPWHNTILVIMNAPIEEKVMCH